VLSGPQIGDGGDNRTELLFRCKPAASVMDSDSDVDQGPKPEVLALSQIVSDRLFRIRFQVKCSKLECLRAPGQTSAVPIPYVIANRWGVSESMDEKFYTTMVVRGRMKVSTPHISPHTHKGLIIPGLNPGFKRQSVLIAVSPNGLEAEYEITDRQVYEAAPSPATKISGSYSESTGTGFLWYSQANVRVEGSPESNRRQLITLATRIIDAKLALSVKGSFATGYQLLNFQITESIGEGNSVECSARIRHIKQETAEDYRALLASLRANLGKRLELQQPDGTGTYDPTISRFPAVYGYDPHGGVRGPAGVLALRCAMHDPCSPDKFYIRGRPAQIKKQEEKSTAVVVKQSQSSLPPPYYPSPYDPSHAEKIYTHYEVQSRYANNHCRVQLPIADSGLAETADSSVVATLARPQARREVTVMASRIGDWPELPEPKDTYTNGNITGTLLRHEMRPQPVEVTAEGKEKVFKIAASYLYALNRMPLPTETLRVGALPFLKRPDGSTTIKQNDLYNSRLEI
jgi:hypothetical protein